MRVLLVNDLAPGAGGGTEVYLERLAGGLTAAGHTVELFAGEVRHHGAAKVLDLWDPWARRALQRRADEFEPDVVHHHNVVRELSAAVLGVPADVATVLTVHDIRLAPGHEARPVSPRAAAFRAKDRFDRRVARRRVDAVTAGSATLAGRLRVAGFDDVEVVPVFAPADLGAVPPVAAAHDVLFAGRLVPGKGILVLAEAFEQLAAAHPRSRLVVAGDGPCRAELEALAARLGGERVHLLGHVDPSVVHGALLRSRVAVAPACEPEGAGLAPVEAALAGRPSIVSDDPALREPVDASGGGFVVPAGDTGALAAALDRLLGDGALAARLGAAARAHAERHHTVAAAVERTVAVYERARMRAHRRRAA